MSTTSYESTRQTLARRTGETLVQKLSATSSSWSRAERRIAISFIKALASGEELEASLFQQTPRVWLGAGNTLLSYSGNADGAVTRLSSDKVKLIHGAFSTASVESLEPTDASF
jgi:hypothetical protein